MLRGSCSSHLELSNGHISFLDVPSGYRSEKNTESTGSACAIDTSFVSSPDNIPYRDTEPGTPISDDADDMPPILTVEEYRSYIQHLCGILAFLFMVILAMINVGVEKGNRMFFILITAQSAEGNGEKLTKLFKRSGSRTGQVTTKSMILLHSPRDISLECTLALLPLAQSVLVLLLGLSSRIPVRNMADERPRRLYFMRMIPFSGLSIHQEMLTALSSTTIAKIQTTGAGILNLLVVLTVRLPPARVLTSHSFAKDAEIVDLQLPLSLFNFVHGMYRPI